MKKLIILFLMMSLVLMLPLSGESKKGEKIKKENNTDVKLNIGVMIIGKDGSMIKAKEYCPVDDGVRPFVKARLKGNLGSTFFNIYSRFNGDLKDQKQFLDFDFNRTLRQTLSFNSLYHRLDHDPLLNIDTISAARSGATAEDFNPKDQYHITRSELKSETTLKLPVFSGLKVYVKYRNEHRSGMYQARTLSKCSSCHIVAKSRSINNINRNIKLGTNVRIGKANVNYSYTNNKFYEKNNAPQNHYLKVIHPEKLSPVFTARIAYGNDEDLPFDSIPESTKNTHNLSTSIPISDNNVFSARFVTSKVENVTSNLKWNSDALSGSYSVRFGKKGFLNAIASYYRIKNDSIFIDVNEPVDVAGPYVGKTYAEAYGVPSFDFTRFSSLSRKVIDFRTNFVYKFSKKLRMKLGYEYNNTERDNFEVAKTQSNTFMGKFTFKPSKKIKFVVDGKYVKATDPFANLLAGVSPAVQENAVGSPLALNSVQFFDWHSQRRATMTNYPENVTKLKGRFHWGPSSKFALNANFLYDTEKNDNLVITGASWDRDMFQWGVDMWATLSAKLPVSLSYYDYKNNYSTLFAIPVIEGCGAGIIGGMTGTLTDMMDLDIRTQSLLLNFNYWAGDKFTLFANFNYNKSKSMIKNLSLDVTQVSHLPGSGGTALNFDNFGGIADYSELNMNQVVGQLGADIALSKKWWLNGSVYYYFYDDIAKYLYTDTAGKNYSFYIGVTWKNL